MLVFGFILCYIGIKSGFRAFNVVLLLYCVC